MIAPARWLIVCIVAVAVFGRPWGAEAQGADASKKSISRLQARYGTLRNTDPYVQKISEWRSLAEAFRGVVRADPRHPSAADALYRAALLEEQVAAVHSDPAARKRAESDLRSVAENYCSGRLCGEAKLRLAEMLGADRERVAEAREILLSLARSAPSADIAEIAEQRAAQLDRSKRGKTQKKTAPQPQASPSLLVVLDPGHGGEDLGAVGIGELMEKDVVLDVALQLEKLLVSRLNAAVRLTRRDDVFVPLAERSYFANDFAADLFISLHINASPKGKISGVQTFYLDNTDDAASKKLAERENRSIQFEGPDADVQFMLSDLIQNAKLDDSVRLAHSVQSALVSEIGRQHRSVVDLGVRKAPFYVLVGAHMPCILVELFFIDHPLDGKRLAEKKFRRQLAEALLSGISAFVKQQKSKR